MAHIKPSVSGTNIALIRNIFCQTCLSSDRILHSIAEYKDICEKLFANIKMIQQLEDMLICWECAAYLRNITRFIKRTEKAQFLLYNTFFENKNYKLKSQSNLSKSKISHSKGIIHKEPVEVVATFDTSEDVYMIKEEPEVETDFKLELGHLEYDSAPDSPQNFVEVPVLDEQHLNSRVQSKPKKEILTRRRKAGEDTFKVTNMDFSYDDFKEVPVEQSFFIDFLAKERRNREFVNAKFRCEGCVLIFNKVTQMKKHMKCHDEAAGSYVCDICRIRCKTEALLISHLNEHHSLFECQLCSMRMNRENRLAHFKQKHKQKVECLECGACFRYLSHFGRHYKSVHLSAAMCDYCEKSFPKKRALIEHISLDHTIHKCNVCNIVFKNRKGLWGHMALKHKKTSKDEEAYCVECDLKFDTVLLYKRHLNISVKHSKKKDTQPVKCPLCDKVYARNIFMLNHYQMVHLKKTKYYCSPCDRYFLSKTRIKEHVWYTHEGRQKKLDKICDICGRGFSDKRTLVHHVHTHTGERPHTCPHCPASFIQKYAMNMHVKTVHLKMKRNECTKAS